MGDRAGFCGELDSLQLLPGPAKLFGTNGMSHIES
jgi:hypothetical protein